MDAFQHLQFIRDIVSIFDLKKLVKHRVWSDLTLKSLWRNGENVLVMYQADIPLPGDHWLTQPCIWTMEIHFISK